MNIIRCCRLKIIMLIEDIKARKRSKVTINNMIASINHQRYDDAAMYRFKLPPYIIDIDAEGGLYAIKRLMLVCYDILQSSDFKDMSHVIDECKHYSALKDQEKYRAIYAKVGDAYELYSDAECKLNELIKEFENEQS